MVKSTKNKKDKNNYARVIQTKWRELMKYKSTIQSEIALFNNILKNILERLNESYRINIISMSEYKKNMTLINNTIENLNSFPHKMTLQYLKSHSNYSILLKLAKIKIGIISLTNNIGCSDIENVMQLYFGNYF